MSSPGITSTVTGDPADPTTRGPSTWRVLAVAVLGTGLPAVVALAAARSAAGSWRRVDGTTAGLADLVAAAAGLVATVLLVWLAVAMFLSAVSHLPGRGARGPALGVSPHLVRRVVAVAVGAAGVGGLLAGPASASPAPPPPPAAVAPAQDGATELLPDPGWSPGPVPAPVRATPEADLGAVPVLVPAPRPGHHVDTDVVVRSGDTLWDLTARHLGASATAAEIAATWPLWHAANRDVIGDDPDRLVPGQRLSVPAPGHR